MFANMLFLLLLAICTSVASMADASDAIESDLCLLPVKYGEPTVEDVNATWRMVSDVVVIEGIERPIIYPLNRSGVWTIGDDYSFSQFGGEFPANVFHDRFVRDPVTGSIVGQTLAKAFS